MSGIPPPEKPLAPTSPASAPESIPENPPGTPAAAATPRPLTPEEQMERFAQELKENDWGHQPC